MEGYSGTPLWKKLGYRDAVAAFVEGAPENYRELLLLPEGLHVTWLRRPALRMDFVHLFVRTHSAFRRRLAFHRKRLRPDGAVWVSWPKQGSGAATDMTADLVRAGAFPLGLVDIKVAAVDATWTALKLVIRRELR